jgi:hypothetical protein
MEQTNTLKWVTAARVVGDYLLELDFNDGRRVVFDCQPLISQYKLFAPLRDKDVFARFALDGWTVTWLEEAFTAVQANLQFASREYKNL